LLISDFVPEEKTEMISFEVIRNVHRAERRSAKLTKLPEDFFEKVNDYLNRKRFLAEKKMDEKAFLEVRNIERLIEEVFNIRERKIINQALIAVRTGIPPENLTKEESDFFNKVVELLKRRREEELKRILERGEVTEEKIKLLIFKEDVPEFVGADMKTYGPFKKGDIAKLPDENAELLVKAGKAEFFETKK
ncbi:MAG TPA: DNA replication complex GINS family protein, partial [Candidatus Aenigmarchaeota archaeon]|nr:DNA replication complex GINS family protein [Candidatus Aenigmarchaeota archaeon]